MSLSAALGAGVARLTLMQAMGELTWLPEGTVDELATLAEHWAENDARWMFYEAQSETDDLVWRHLARQLHDMEPELTSLLWEVAEAYTASQPGLWNAGGRVGGTLTLPGGHTLRVNVHPTTCWLLDVFGPAADAWVATTSPDTWVVRP